MTDEPQDATPQMQPIGQRLGNIDDLPKELLDQLHTSAALSEEDRDILFVLNDTLSGIGKIDEIMVALWRLDGSVHERKTLAARITRMVKKDILVSIEGKRGVYTTSKE